MPFPDQMSEALKDHIRKSGFYDPVIPEDRHIVVIRNSKWQELEKRPATQDPPGDVPQMKDSTYAFDPELTIAFSAATTSLKSMKESEYAMDSHHSPPDTMDQVTLQWPDEDFCEWRSTSYPSSLGSVGQVPSGSGSPPWPTHSQEQQATSGTDNKVSTCAQGPSINVSKVSSTSYYVNPATASTSVYVQKLSIPPASKTSDAQK